MGIRKNRKIKVLIIALVMIICLCAESMLVFAQEDNGFDVIDEELVFAEDTADIVPADHTGGNGIEDWDYEFGTNSEGQKVFVRLYRYNGLDKEVYVPASFSIDGVPYITTVTNGASVPKGRDESIFPEYVESVVFGSGVIAYANVSKMFAGCSNLKSVDLSGLDTSEATNIARMFYNCSSLEYIDVSHMNVSKAADVAMRYYDNYELTEEIFRGCSSLKSIDISNWMFCSEANLKGMFRDCTSLEEVKFASIKSDGRTLEEFGLGTNMAGVFDGCSKLRSVTFPVNLDLTKCASVNDFFNGCSSLEEIDISDWQIEQLGCDSTWGIGGMDQMFFNCTSLKKVKLPVVPKVIQLTRMFSGCSKLEEIDMSGVDLGVMASFGSGTEWGLDMFAGTTSLRTIKSPVNVGGVVPLPTAFTGSDDVSYTSFPMNNPNSITLTLNSASVVPLDSIIFTRGETLEVNSNYGETFLYLSFLPETAAYKTADLTVSDTSVIRIEKIDEENYSVFPLKKGTAVVTATAKDGSGVTAKCTVIVDGGTGTDPGPIPGPEEPTDTKVTGVTLNYTQLTMKGGETKTLSAVVAPDNAANKSVKWSYTKPQGDPIPSVTESTKSVDGFIISQTFTMTADYVTRTKTSVITVTTDDGGYTAECYLTVYPAEETNTQPDVPNPGYSEPEVPAPGPVPGPASGVVLVKGQKYDISSMLSDRGFLIDKKTKLTVSNAKVASVTKTGLVTAKAYADSAEVLCNGEKTGITVMTEIPKMSEKTITLSYVGQTYPSATNLAGVYSASPKWEIASSKNPAASIDPSTGVITALNRGSIKVNAVFENGGVKGAIKIPYTVKVNIPQLSKKELTVLTGATSKLTVKNVSKTQAVGWTSSDPSVVKVDDQGKTSVTLTAVASGTATVSAVVDGHSYSCEVTVPVPSAKKQIYYVKPGKSISLTLKDTKLKINNFVWSSDNTEIASVNPSTGKITGVSNGMTVIYGTYTDAATGGTVTVYAGVEVK